MKKNSIIYIMLMLLSAGLTGCSEESVSMNSAKLPDETTIGNTGSALRSKLSFSGKARIDLFEAKDGDFETTMTDELFLSLSQPTSSEVKTSLSIGTELTEEFMTEAERVNAQLKEYYKTHYYLMNPTLFKTALLPPENIQLETNTLTVPAGKAESESVMLTLSNKGLDTGTIYLLSLVVEQTGTNDNKTSPKQTLQYLISVHPKDLKVEDYNIPPGMEITLDSDIFTVLYLNTETYQPLLADIFDYTKISMITWETEKACFIGNIVNLKPATVGYDTTTGRALFNLGPDLRYVLEHAAKYIRPLQNRGRKVCICIQNGDKGIGFCNMTDAQIADFTAQVKEIIELYDIDGVNLWDEGSAYSVQGMPEVNMTSYPKLIKSLDDALPSKLITLVDKDKPTEHFYDINLCGGIEVGKYIDYAWHGYASEEEIVQVIEPWETNPPYSEYTRKPIAGLTPEQYGSINAPRYKMDGSMSKVISEASKRVTEWKMANRKKSNILVFGFDLTANEQGVYEWQPRDMAFDSFINAFANDGYIWAEDPWSGEWGLLLPDYWYMQSTTNPNYTGGYRLYSKDW